MNFDVAFADRRRALDRLDVLDFRRDFRFVRQIGALEFQPAARRRGSERKRNLRAGVQRDAGQAGDPAEGVLSVSVLCHGVASR